MHVNLYHLDTRNWFPLVEQWTEEKAWSGRSLAWLTRIRLEFIMRLTEINDVHDRQEKVRRLNSGLLKRHSPLPNKLEASKCASSQKTCTWACLYFFFPFQFPVIKDSL